MTDSVARPGSASSAGVSISAVICTYSDQRWDLLVSSVESLLRQHQPLKEIIVVVDHNPTLLSRVAKAFPEVIAVGNHGPKGLSGARNTGTEVASGEIIASLDDDAEASPNWSLRLFDDFADPRVIGVGCFIEPVWPTGRYAWFPMEFAWVVGCTYRGVPTGKQPIRNPLGAAMALRREAVERAGGYCSNLGRLDKNPLGCEETELCIRIRRQNPRALIIQDPSATVRHHVPKERMTLKYFRRRCYAEGVSKAAVTRAVGKTDALATERTYVTRVLPHGVWTGIKDAGRGDLWGLARAGAIIGGLLWTTTGYLAGGRSLQGQPPTMDQPLHAGRLARQP